MGAAACLLKQAGYSVEGGDHNYGPPMSDYLKRSGVVCHMLDELDQSYLRQFDLIVTGNIVAGAGPEARMIERLGVPFASFPAVLGALVLEDIPNVVGLAGTHGKTTSTYLMAQLFENLGERPGYLVGGVIEGREASTPGEGKYFFIESDEYETAYFEKYSKFRNYCLNHLVVTSLEFDHAEFFKDIEAIKLQFNMVMNEIKGSFIFNSHYPAIKDLEIKNHPVMWYGVDTKQGPVIVTMTEKGSTFNLIYNETNYEFSTNIVGKHNIENLSACILYAFSEGFKYEEIQRAINDLKMVKRRQEVRGRYKGALVIDDFAHHPKAVEATLDGLKIQYPDKKMVVVFGASSATARSDLFQQEFTEALKIADQTILITPEHDTSVSYANNLNCEEMSDELINLGVPTTVATGLENILKQIDASVGENVLLVVLSNSNCSGLWESRFVEEIQ